MENTLWLNLPSKNLESAKTFFKHIGFKINDRHKAPHMVSLFVGSNKVVVNLFKEEQFREFIGGHRIADANTATEILMSIGATSPEEVDQMAKKVTEAGGTLYAEPAHKDGWMYGCGFVDLDGHRWNILYMDMNKMPQG